MSNKQQNHDQYPYYGYDPEEWTPRVRVFGWSLIGTLVIFWLCSYITIEDQFWNVFVIGTITWLILVTAWVQLGVTQKQWVSMQEGLELTRDIFTVSERAYLSIDDVNIPGETFSYELSNTFVFDITNGGRTPAFNVCIKTNPTASEDEIDESLMENIKSGFRKIEGVQQLHLANKKEQFRLIPSTMLPEGTNAKWLAGRVRVYIPIRVSYEDVRRHQLSLIYWYELRPRENIRLIRPLELQVDSGNKTGGG
jgi:hypothetical protein